MQASGYYDKINRMLDLENPSFWENSKG